MEREREREKPVRDWLWPSSLIGILLLATDASFHNKSPTPCLSSCQGIFFLNCMWGASYGVNLSLFLSLSLASHPQPAF